MEYYIQKLKKNIAYFDTQYAPYWNGSCPCQVGENPQLGYDILIGLLYPNWDKTPYPNWDICLFYDAYNPITINATSRTRSFIHTHDKPKLYFYQKTIPLHSPGFSHTQHQNINSLTDTCLSAAIINSLRNLMKHVVLNFGRQSTTQFSEKEGTGGSDVICHCCGYWRYFS
jgi:hypothetical protein